MTQTLENYGTHCESGKFSDGQSYWKFKGGDTYLVEDLDREQDAIAFIAALVMENGIGYKEYPSAVMTVQEWAADLPDDAGEQQSCRDYYLSQVVRVSPETTTCRDGLRSGPSPFGRTLKGMSEAELSL